MLKKVQNIIDPKHLKVSQVRYIYIYIYIYTHIHTPIDFTM